MLPFVVPATLLTALGLALALEWIEQWATAQHWRLSHVALSLSTFAVLAGFNGFMLWDALVNGPLWFRDYTLYGLQYGAKQVFGELTPALLERDPNARVFISPSWANGTDQLLTFFVKPDLLARTQMGTVDDYLTNRRPLEASMFFVMMPQEYERAATSPKFKSVTVEQILPYPDGLPGFYVGQLAYADNVDAIFAAEREERQKPVVETLAVNGETLTVAHSLFDGGSLKDLFDGDAFTLARGQEANPLIIEIAFPTPRTVSTLRLTVGSMDNFTVNVAAFAPNTDQPVTYSNNFVSLPADPQVDIPLAQGPAPLIRLRLEIKNNLAGFPTNIHVREIAFQE
jgi:hypothetical protein